MMTETSLDIDLSLLVGPMDEMECEHSQHRDSHPKHDSGPATHYIKVSHECLDGLVYAACERFATMVEGGQIAVYCHLCGVSELSGDSISVVGKVNG